MYLFIYMYQTLQSSMRSYSTLLIPHTSTSLILGIFPKRNPMLFNLKHINNLIASHHLPTTIRKEVKSSQLTSS